MDTAPLMLRLDQLPLWRLLVALSDAERVAGSNSPTARALAGEIKRRLAGPIPADTADGATKGGSPNG